MRYPALPTILLLLAIFCTFPASAQQKDRVLQAPVRNLNPAFSLPNDDQDFSDDPANQPDPLKSTIFLNLSPSTQDALLAESDAFYKDCELKTAYAAKHSCECLSLQYLNERLQKPDESVSRIMNHIKSQCVDSAATAGYAYNKCMTLYATMYPDGLKNLCECYGRQFAQAYMRQPSPNSDYEISLGSQVLMACRQKMQSIAPSEPVVTNGGDLNSLKPY